MRYILTLIAITTISLHAQGIKPETPALTAEGEHPHTPKSYTGLELNWSETNLPSYLVESSFRAYVPNSLLDSSKNVTKPRAILIIIPGFNGDGRVSINEWQAFAEAEKAMVIGTCFKTGQENYELELGMANVLDQGVAQLLQLAGISNQNIPWIITGHSTGGNVILTKAAANPSQILAIAVSKWAGVGKLPAVDSKPTYDIPTLFYLVSKDPTYEKLAMQRYCNGLKNKAHWTLVLDKNDRNEQPEQVKSLFREYFSAMLESRLGPVNPSEITTTNEITDSPKEFMKDGTNAEECVSVPNPPKIFSALLGA